MKRCPTCQRTFTEGSQKFCPSDGTPLVEEQPAFDPEATVMSSSRQINEETPSPAPPASPPSTSPPPTPYYSPDSGAGSQPEQNAYQSAPPPGATPPAAWPPPPPPQQQPYYPQSGTPGGQPAPQWPGGPQQPGWPPDQQQGQPPQGQWGGGYYPQPGQYAPYGVQATGGKSGVALAALICGILAFVLYACVIVIIGTRMLDLYFILWTLRWVYLGAGFAGLVLGLIGLIISKTGSGKVKAGIGLFLGVLVLICYQTGLVRYFL